MKQCGSTAEESITIDGEAGSGGANGVGGRAAEDEEIIDSSPCLHSEVQRQPPLRQGQEARTTGTGSSGTGAHDVTPRRTGERVPVRATGRDGCGPGAHAIPGPMIAAGPGIGVRQHAPLSGDASTAEEDGTVYEGFLPPTRRERREARLRREVEEMRRSAITLDDSAVRTVRGPNEAVRGGGRVGVEWGLLLSVMMVLSLWALVYDLSGAKRDAFSSGTCNGSNAAVAGNVEDRYKHAKSIASDITPLDNLDDPSSPQHKALHWIVCQDEISSRLIDGRDPATGVLPTQANGFHHGGNSGEAQVLRRYALAAFFFATSEKGPWSDTLNFLTPDAHECSWHKNKTRRNFPYLEIDPAGLACAHSVDWGPIVLDDAAGAIGRIDLNFRISNNLSGTIPPEFGYLEDVAALSFESQKGLYGSLSSTIGKMSGLKSFSILFMGPKLGGTIPSSLFTLPSMEWITFMFNEGIWALPSSIELAGSHSRLTGLYVKSSGLTGTVSPIISKLTNLRYLEFEGNHLEGSIPDSFGSILPSLEYLNFRDNDLIGTLPRSLGQLANLTAMAFGKNNFQGPIPSSLGNLSKLRLLDLSNNELEGPVPDSFSQLSSLEHASLQNNRRLNGSISAFEPLENLTSLLLYENSFSSTIPAGLFSDSSGVNIFADFGHNNFSGKIPRALSRKASNTSYLAIMKNNFDDRAVDDTTCEEVEILFADCTSCPCCKNSCCMQDSAQKSGDLFDQGHKTPQKFCNFDLDFRRLVGLECGVWWDKCRNSPYDPRPLE